MTTTAITERRPRWRRWTVIAVSSVLLVLMVLTAWIVVRALLARAELEAIVPIARSVQDAAADRDVDALAGLVADAERHATAAADLTTDPIWRGAEGVPLVGPNLAAVRTVAESAASLAASASPLTGYARDLVDADARGSLGLLGDAREPLADAADAFTRADASLSALQLSDLLGPVADAVRQVGDFVREATPAVEAVSEASQILPPLLGTDGTRTLLVMLQNSAELRAGGGIAGSFVLLEADGSGFQILRQADSSQFDDLPEPIIPLPAETDSLLGDDVGRFVQNTSMTPDFALTGDLVSAWWAGLTGTPPDAVLSLDMTTIVALLGESGPVVLPDGTSIPADDLVDRVLVDAYFDYDYAEQTIFQEAVTAAAIDRVLGDGIDPIAWMSAFAEPVEEGRVSAWSSVPEEQERIAHSVLGGATSRHALAGPDSYAVYFNDATAGKMDAYLDVDIAYGSARCRTDGRDDVLVAVTLTNSAPAVASTWPLSVTGGGSLGIPPGDIATDVVVAAPAGAFYGSVLRDGTAVVTADGEVDGFPTIRARTTIAPGQSSTVEFRFVSAESDPGPPTVLHTPLLRPATYGDVRPSCG